MNRYKLKDISLSKLEYGSGAAACEYDGKTRYVRITDIGNEGNLGTDVVSPNSVDDKYLLNDGDVLFARTGATVGKTYLYRSSAGRCIYAGFLIRVVPNQKIIRPDYLYYFTKSPQYKGFVKNSMKIVAQPNINAKQYGDLEFNVPLLEEQDLIIKKLNTISSLIILRRTELTRLDELIKARFVEMFGNVPEEEKVTMAEICKVITDGTHQPPEFTNTGIPFLLVSNIVTNEICYDTEKFISEETYNELIKRTPIEVGDILLSTVGSYGHPAIVKIDRRFCFQRHIAYLKPKLDIVDSEYLRGAILSDNVQSQIDERVRGIAQKTLNLSEIRKIRLPLPPMELQNQYAEFVAQIDKSKLMKFLDIFTNQHLS